MHDPRRGILLAIAFSVLILAMDALVKQLTQLYPLFMVVWARYAFHIAVTPLLGTEGGLRGLVATRRPGLQLLRSVCMFGATVSFFTAIKFIPLADAIAIGFVTPFLISGLAIPILGETVGPRRWAACAVSLVGAFIIIRPGFEARHWAYFLPLAAAVCYALYAIATRLISQTERPTTSLFYTAATGGLLASAGVPFVWQPPSLAGWAMLALVGALAAVSHLLLIRAYRYAPASLLAPFSYLEVIWATLFGFIFFGDFPDTPTWFGVALIVASGLYIFRSEARRRGAAVT